MNTQRSALVVRSGLLLSCLWLIAGLGASPAPTLAAPPAPPDRLRGPASGLAATPAAPALAAGQQTFFAVADTMVVEGYPDANYGDFEFMLAGYDGYFSPPGLTCRSLLAFDLTGLPGQQQIARATLRLRLWSGWDYSDTGRTITTYRLAGRWAEESVAWNNQPDLAEAYGSRIVWDDVGTWYEFDVTDLVQGWQAGSLANDGLMLRGPEAPGAEAAWRGFYTHEVAGRGAELRVEYASAPNTPPTLSGLPDQLLLNGNADNAIDLWAYAGDVKDCDSALTFRIQNTPDPGAGVAVDRNRYIDIRPAAGWSGGADAQIRVRDTGGLTAHDTFRVTVVSQQSVVRLPLVSN